MVKGFATLENQPFSSRLAKENGVSYVLDLSQITSFIDAIMMPLIGGLALLLAKASQGEAARWAERQFFAVLLVITVVTLRTVITCHETWIVHTTTLGMLVICSLLIPGASHVPFLSHPQRFVDMLRASLQDLP